MMLDIRYFLLVGPFMLLAWWASNKVKGTFARYNQGRLRSGVSGYEVAERILQASGLAEVKIQEVPGMLSDHYNPQTRTVALSKEILHGRTPAAVAVAAHECGHALQHAQGYKMMELRSSMVPVVSLGSNLAMPLIMLGMVLLFLTRHMTPLSYYAILIGVVGFALAVLFHFVTLPVEFDASNRAIKILEGSGLVSEEEMPGVRKTLYAAGFTYVASALVALSQLLYYVMILMSASGRNR